jgi:hypothetical protein
LRAMMARPRRVPKPDHPARSRPGETVAALRRQSAARPDGLPSRDGAAPCKDFQHLVPDAIRIAFSTNVRNGDGAQLGDRLRLKGCERS